MTCINFAGNHTHHMMHERRLHSLTFEAFGYEHLGFLNHSNLDIIFYIILQQFLRPQIPDICSLVELVLFDMQSNPSNIYQDGPIPLSCFAAPSGFVGSSRASLMDFFPDE
jgi:hypothetical protein